MRVLYVIHTWHPEGHGGTEVHAHQAALALSGRGHQIGVFARTGRPERPEYEVVTEWEGRIGVTRINNTFQEAPSFPWVYKNERIHQAFERELDEFKPDLVHVHHLTGLSSTLVEEIKGRGLPLVMTLHDFWMVCPRGQRMTSDLELCAEVDRNRCYTCLGGLWPHIFKNREEEPTIVDVRGRLSPASLAEWDRHMAYVLNLCDVLIAPSAFHRERMLDFPVSPERIVTLPHGLDHAPYMGIEREPRPVKTIGYIGSVIPVKGVHVLLDAFRRLGRSRLQLSIHGEMPPFHDDRTYGARLRDQARGMPNVHFRGPYRPEDLPRILSEIDVLVVPSLWWETYCLTIREGLLAGVPVVASDLGAMREALDGEQDGLLFAPGDAGQLAERLELLIRDDALRARLSGRRHGVKPIEVFTAELEQLYRRAEEESSRRQGSLVVAPPSFPRQLPVVPEATPAAASIPWDRLGVAISQQGRASVALSTSMPTSERPILGVGLHIKDGEQDLGAVDVRVDLAPLAAAPPPPATGNGGSAPTGSGEAPPGTTRTAAQGAVSSTVRRVDRRDGRTVRAEVRRRSLRTERWNVRKGPLRTRRLTLE